MNWGRVVKALAFYNWGEWKAMCPADGCHDAVGLYPAGAPAPVTSQRCARGHAIQIDMPGEQLRAQIEAVLADRPMDADRSWYPPGHEWAITHGFATGQTVAALAEESLEVAEARATQRTAKQDQTRAALAELGITVRPDGTFDGSIL